MCEGACVPTAASEMEPQTHLSPAALSAGGSRGPLSLCVCVCVCVCVFVHLLDGLPVQR